MSQKGLPSLCKIEVVRGVKKVGKHCSEKLHETKK